MASRMPLTRAYCAEIAGRLALATIIGFAFSSAVVLAGSSLLTVTGVASRGGAVHGMTMSTWLIWCGVAMAAFHTPRPWRMVAWLTLISIVCTLIAVQLGWNIS
jgi:hypothetical protein